MELACRNATEKPSEANLVRLLDLWSADWKHRGRTFRARRGGRGLQCHGPAGGLRSRQRLSPQPLSEGHLDVHRRALQPSHGPAPRHSEHARALESCACFGRLHRRTGVDRTSRGGLHGLAGRQEERARAAGQVAGHARSARQLRCPPLSHGGATRGQHVGPRCICSASLCSGNRTAPAGAERSGLSAACLRHQRFFRCCSRLHFR